MSKLGKVLTLIAGVVVGVTAQGHATTVLPLDLKGLTEVSEVVVLGHVVNVHAGGRLSLER